MKYSLEPSKKLSAYTKAVIVLSSLCAIMLAYDIYEFRSLMLSVFTGVK